MAAPKVLIVGAQEHSLGWHIALACRNIGLTPVTAGISVGKGRDETYEYDVRGNVETHEDFMEEMAQQEGVITHVVYTAGINKMRGIGTNWDTVMQEHMAVNYEGAVKCFKAWMMIHGAGEPLTGDPHPSGVNVWQHFVAISSNSAHIARRDSLPYCASKAALSMAIRCLGRTFADTCDRRLVVYGYEPGWLDNTPMSQEIEQFLNIGGFDQRPHRIPGSEFGINPAMLARQIALNLTIDGRMLNGTMLRVDGGEQ